MEHPEPLFFSSPLDFNRWLALNHARESALWVGYYKKATRIPSITWPESVDEALCFGWIDGLRKSIDSQSYMVRFTPRKRGSTWSKVNLERYAELEQEGRIEPAGQAAWDKRIEEAAVHSQSRHNAKLPPKMLKKLKENPAAWEYYRSLSDSVRRQSDWYVISAKREETKEKRLGILIESCEQAKKIPQLRWPRE